MAHRRPRSALKTGWRSVSFGLTRHVLSLTLLYLPLVRLTGDDSYICQLSGKSQVWVCRCQNEQAAGQDVRDLTRCWHFSLMFFVSLKMCSHWIVTWESRRRRTRFFFAGGLHHPLSHLWPNPGQLHTVRETNRSWVMFTFGNTCNCFHTLQLLHSIPWLVFWKKFGME